MWTRLLDTNFMDVILNKAKVIIQEDRARYLPFLQKILDALKNEKHPAFEQFYISDMSALVEDNKCMETLVIFSTTPIDLGKELTRIVCKEYESLFKTVIQDESYRIEYDSRRLCTINRIFDLSPIKQYFVFKTIYGLCATPILLELIRYLRNLYSFEHFENWITIHKHIQKIFPMMTQFEPKQNTNNNPHADMQKILVDYLFKKEYLLLDIKSPYNIEIISKNSLNYDIERFSEFFQNAFGGGLVWQEKKIQLLEDMRLSKYSVYCLLEGRRVPMLSIYYNGKYDMLGYSDQDGYWILDSIPRMRHCLINILLGIYNNPETTMTYISHYFWQSKVALSQIDLYSKKELFGTYESDEIAKKLRALSNRSKEKNTFMCKDLL